VELAGPVEVEDGVEGARVTVEEELVFHEGVVATPEVVEGREIVWIAFSWWTQEEKEAVFRPFLDRARYREGIRYE
jgi:hypothetical protein